MVFSFLLHCEQVVGMVPFEGKNILLPSGTCVKRYHMDLLHFVFVNHFSLACMAALLSVSGALLAFPAVRWGPSFLVRMPLALFRMVRSLMGSRPGLLRMGIVIFVFNGSAMFVYMASGVRPLLPFVIAALTGFNIAVILLLADQAVTAKSKQGPTAIRWVPGNILTGLCGAAVLLLELPCFWYAIALGVDMGRVVTEGQAGYTQALAVRAEAYIHLILPVLLLSAICEVIAIRGMEARSEQQNDTPF